MEEKMRALIDKYLKYGKDSEVDSLWLAFEIAKKAHEGQFRKSGEAYIFHPLSVAEIVIDMAMDADSIKAALMHDTVEDTTVTQEEIKKNLGQTVAELVDGLTKLEHIQYSNKEEEEMENLRKMFLAMAKDIRVILIKLADRLHNMRTIGAKPESKQRVTALETMEIYAPIAHRLGITTIEWELEEMCLRCLDPIGYKEVTDGLASFSRINDDLIGQVKHDIGTELEKFDVKGNITGRVKNTYSIYRKLYLQNRSLDEIYDIYAVRVIVDTEADCYTVLGIVHNLYKPVPGRFKDYISTPKPNLYQSLHTTVIGGSGVPFEVQIRTWSMHYIAEYGVAAHWKYKHGLGGTLSQDDEKLAWVRQLLENQADSDADDFIHNMKIDLFEDDVYVFTPKGDVICLPVGANTIDLAYAIHSGVGNRMMGAKINGRMVPIDYQLKNGEVCEILTSNAGRGPSRDWLKIVKTGEARTKIRQWFKKERREENIAQGRTDLEHELKRERIPIVILDNDEIMEPVAKKLSFNSVDELLAGVGYGGVTVMRTVNRIKEAVSRGGDEGPVESAEAVIEKAVAVSRTRKIPEGGVIVEGLDSCLVKLAKCCTPVPGDDIVGFVTRGYGVSIHQRECINVRKILNGDSGEELNRLVRVRWAIEERGVYPATLRITAVNRIGLFADIANVLANMQIMMSPSGTRDTDDGMSELVISVDVSNKKQLDLVCTKINSVRGVIDIKRRPSGGA